MSLTLANLEAELIVTRGLGFWFERVGIDIRVDGTNTAVNALIRQSLRAAGFPVTDSLLAVDTDLSGVLGDDTEEVLDLAELRGLKLVRVNWIRAITRLREGETPVTDQMITLLRVEERSLDDAIKAMQERCDSLYGESVASLTTGSFNLDFMATDCPEF